MLRQTGAIITPKVSIFSAEATVGATRSAFNSAEFDAASTFNVALTSAAGAAFDAASTFNPKDHYDRTHNHQVDLALGILNSLYNMTQGIMNSMPLLAAKWLALQLHGFMVVMPALMFIDMANKWDVAAKTFWKWYDNNNLENEEHHESLANVIIAITDALLSSFAFLGVCALDLSLMATFVLGIASPAILIAASTLVGILGVTTLFHFGRSIYYFSQYLTLSDKDEKEKMKTSAVNALIASSTLVLLTVGISLSLLVTIGLPHFVGAMLLIATGVAIAGAIGFAIYKKFQAEKAKPTASVDDQVREENTTRKINNLLTNNLLTISGLELVTRKINNLLTISGLELVTRKINNLLTISGLELVKDLAEKTMAERERVRVEALKTAAEREAVQARKTTAGKTINRVNEKLLVRKEKNECLFDRRLMLVCRSTVENVCKLVDQQPSMSFSSPKAF